MPVGQPLARFDKIKPATHRYLRYKQVGDTITPLDVWTREIRIEPDKAGVKRLHIVQHWDGAGGQLSIGFWGPHRGRTLETRLLFTGVGQCPVELAIASVLPNGMVQSSGSG